jgi:hypothetical protein
LPTLPPRGRAEPSVPRILPARQLQIKATDGVRQSGTGSFSNPLNLLLFFVTSAALSLPLWPLNHRQIAGFRVHFQSHFPWGQ